MSEAVLQIDAKAEDRPAFHWHLMLAIENAIMTTTGMQLASSISTAQTSEAMGKMLEEGNDRLAVQAQKVADADKDDIPIEQTKYNQMSTEEASKETMMKGTLDVTQQTTTQYSSTMQQEIQTGGIIAQLNSSIGEMLKKGY